MIEVLEVLKKSMYATVGLAVMTREKVEETAKKIVEEAKMTEGEGKKFVDELKKKSQEGRDALEKFVNDSVETAFKKMNIPTRGEIKSLEERIRRLETGDRETK